MIGERQIVEIVLVVIRIERAPAAIVTLQAFDPFAGAGYGLIVRAAAPARRPVHRHDNNCGIVEVRVIVVVVLEGPAAWPDIGALVGPVPCDIEHLPRPQPVERAVGAFHRRFAADFQHGMGGKRGIPDR